MMRPVLLCTFISWVLLPVYVAAFVPNHYVIILQERRHPPLSTISSTRIRLSADRDDESDDTLDASILRDIAENRNVANDLGFEIIRGDSDDLSDETWDDLEGGAPSRWMVMKDLMGINIFTYILAALIIFFLSMNAISGPGWLGQSLGWEDVGTFTKTSDALPLNVDVSGPDYLL